jgi:hypothetical protein
MAGTKTLDEIVALGTNLRGSNLRTFEVKDVAALVVEFLSNAGELPHFSTTSNQTWFRGRICNEGTGYANLRDVIYPPKTVDFGRANIPGRRVFYASWNILAVMDELSVRSGQYVQIVAARAREKAMVPCADYGELTHLLYSGRIRRPAPQLEQWIANMWLKADANTQRRLQYVDAFVSEEFRKVRTHSVEYQVTAAIAEIFHESGGGGIIYPSVASYAAENVAVSAEVFDEKFEVLWTEVHRIDRFYGYGVYDATITRRTCDFDPDGLIKWDSGKEYRYQEDPIRGDHSPEAGYVGWRVK